MQVSRRIAILRAAYGLTQSEMALSLGVGRAAFANWEQGTRTPNIEIMCKMADKYGVSLDWLYRGRSIRTFDTISVDKSLTH
jgi:transcriptional regulator with XRE-family HTH domain